MATIRNLVVSLSANSAKLVSELAKSRKTLKAWANNVISTAKVASAAFGVAAAAGVAGFIAVVNKSAEAIDKVTKAAGKLQFPIEDYQRFAFIAAKSNIDMDNFGKSMQKMLKTVGDARAGLSTATDAFDQLNLSADELAQMSPSDQFALIAERMALIPIQADRVKVAMDIFGRGGADLLNVFASDVRGIGDEFDSLGITITQTQADAVARFQDAKTSLGTLFNGFSQNVTAEVAPVFAMTVEKITDSIKNMGGMKEAAHKFSVFIVRAMIATVEAIGGAVTQVQELILALKQGQLMYMLMDNLAGKLVPFGEDYSPEQLQKVADDILDMEKRIAKGNGVKQSLIDFLNELKTTVEDQPVIKPNDLKLPDGTRDYEGIVAMMDGANKAGQANQQLATAASNAAKTLDDVTKSKAWKDIFGGAEVTARASQFDDYAKLVKSNIESGSGFATSDLNTLKDILQTAINNGGVGFSNNGLFERLDLTGMGEVVKGLEAMLQSQKDKAPQVQDQIAGLMQQGQVSQNVIDKLIQTQQGQKTLGKLELNMITDTGKIAGEIWGEPEFIMRLRDEVNRQTANAARANAGG